MSLLRKLLVGRVANGPGLHSVQHVHRFSLYNIDCVRSHSHNIPLSCLGHCIVPELGLGRGMASFQVLIYEKPLLSFILLACDQLDKTLHKFVVEWEK